jgi:low affinity Fe/Cu permease
MATLCDSQRVGISNEFRIAVSVPAFFVPPELHPNGMNNPDKSHSLNARFGRLAGKMANWVGTSWAFALAVLSVLIWGISGPYFKYSDTWQLVINTATTVITFLIVFLIQNTQNRDARALHLKLDELIRAVAKAHNEMINIETLSDAELEHMAKVYERFSQAWKSRHRQAG